jgi:hypothetical protein
MLVSRNKREGKYFKRSHGRYYRTYLPMVPLFNITNTDKFLAALSPFIKEMNKLVDKMNDLSKAMGEIK